MPYKDIEKVLKQMVQQKKRPVYFLLTVQAGIKRTQAELEWCQESIELMTY